LQYPVSLAAASNDDNFTGAVSGLPRVWTLEEEVWGIKYVAGYKFGPWDVGEGIAGSDLTLIPWVGVFGLTMTGQ